ncbi:BgTH12-04200 [Blumeria graminis f. sp. triticale]|uniref:BgTH12-04200 n=1 Tax=Blumeria graminis f. sp. triticale TaxID=1689686 RepID=A0A9W4CXB7_BLUGR|nr:BgTH12-04200 [Blumeria graminis f. sp. triticale]
MIPCKLSYNTSRATSYLSFPFIAAS